MKTLIMLIVMMISFNAYAATDCDIIILDKDVTNHKGTVKVSDGNSILYIIRTDKNSAADLMAALKNQVGDFEQYSDWAWGNSHALVEEFKDHTRAYVHEPENRGLQQKVEVCKIEEVEFDL